MARKWKGGMGDNMQGSWESHDCPDFYKMLTSRCQALERGLTAQGIGVFLQMADAILCFA